jgi:hypothetical protein
MNAPLVHSKFGGSTASRILRCPASVGLVEKVPARLRKSSAYADRGTALHAAITLLLDEKESLGSLAGKMIGTYTITSDDVENALRPVFTYVAALLDTPGAEFYLEHRVAFPGVAGAFGTADLIVRIGSIIHVIDLKFGAGVRVLAVYPDGDEDVINSQLLFYTCGSRHSLSEFFSGVDDIVLSIVQPVTADINAEMVSSVVVTHAELDAFIVAYRAACEEALTEAPRLEKGSHCRFCAARPICPAHTGPLLDLAEFAQRAPLHAAPPPKELYLQLLADGLNFVDAVKDIGVALREQAKRALQDGDVVPGYALTAGRAERHWRDSEPVAIAALTSLGLARGDIAAEKLFSPRQIEIRAKARGLKIPSEFIISRRSGTSLVRSENAHTPVPGRGELMRSFSAALKALEKKHGQS